MRGLVVVLALFAGFSIFLYTRMYLGGVPGPSVENVRRQLLENLGITDDSVNVTETVERLKISLAEEIEHLNATRKHLLEASSAALKALRSADARTQEALSALATKMEEVLGAQSDGKLLPMARIRMMIRAAQRNPQAQPKQADDRSERKRVMARLRAELVKRDIRGCRDGTGRPHVPDELGNEARAVFVGDPAKCEGWTHERLLRLPPGVVPDTKARWNAPIGLGYTVAPTHCLHQHGWTKQHLINASAQYDSLWFLHVMKTGGSALRLGFSQFGRRNGLGDSGCSVYHSGFRLGSPVGNLTLVETCLRNYNYGHLMQFGYQHKFPKNPHFGKSGLYVMSFRDPFLRAVSIFDYFQLIKLGSKEDFFKWPVRPRTDYFEFTAAFHTMDAFWYLGVERIRSTDTPEEQLRKIEQCKFVIRSIVPLIAERPMESHALMATVLGGRWKLPLNCKTLRVNEKFGKNSDLRPLDLNITRRGTRFGMLKMRWQRVLYEYAYSIFELRLEQFGIQQLLRKHPKCKGEDFLDGDFGRTRELMYMDNITQVLP